MPTTNKKYQIFVSSTFLDLQTERSLCVSAVMRMGSIPTGMELFPASDAAQWSVIEQTIREADYYVLLVAGRYGSLLGERSYTEAEYTLAVEQGIPIVPLIHKRSAQLFDVSREAGPLSEAKLSSFRERLSNSHTCQYWDGDAELGMLLYQGLLDVMQRSPRVGWIRGDQAADEASLKLLLDLQSQNEQLKQELIQLRNLNAPAPADLVQGTELIWLTGTIKFSYNYTDTDWKKSVSINLLLEILGPQIRQPTSTAGAALSMRLLYYVNDDGTSVTQNRVTAFAITVNEASAYRALNQLELLGLVSSAVHTTTQGGQATFWTLTGKGNKLLSEMLAYRKKSQ